MGRACKKSSSNLSKKPARQTVLTDINYVESELGFPAETPLVPSVRHSPSKDKVGYIMYGSRAAHTLSHSDSTPLAYSTISSPPSLLSPYSRSTNEMGTSATEHPMAFARTIISIWNV